MNAEIAQRVQELEELFKKKKDELHRLEKSGQQSMELQSRAKKHQTETDAVKGELFSLIVQSYELDRLLLDEALAKAYALDFPVEEPKDAKKPGEGAPPASAAPAAAPAKKP